MRARRYLEQVLAQGAVSDHGRDVFRFQDVVRFGTDLRVSTRMFLARVLWLQGFADQAVRTVERSLGEAEATGHAVLQCYGPRLGGVSDRLLGGRPGRRGPLHRHAGRPVATACPAVLGRVRRQV